MHTSFPCGLLQPPGSFRFSLDALLLAAFAMPARTETRLLDMGTGCGVVALRILLHAPWVQAIALDKHTALLDAALHNAAGLGLAERLQTVLLDVEALLPAPVPGTVPASDTGNRLPALLQEPVALVTANPPYRLYGTGRLPQSPLRRSALFARHQTLAAFCHLACLVLRPQGRFCCIFPAPEQERLYQALQEAGLSIHIVQPVHSTHKSPTWVLVEARKEQGKGTDWRSPLFVHHPDSHRLTPEILQLCPELAKGHE